MITRRLFVVALGMGALAAPFCSSAQQRLKVWRVGYLGGSARSPLSDEFLRAMRSLGYEEGRNLAIELRHADGQYERLPALAADLVNRKVDVIVAGTTPAAKAAQQATSTIAIVMATVGDPVRSGLVASLARPGGNITGLSLATTDTSAKWLELARIVAPQSSRIAVLGNPNQPTAAAHLRNIQDAAQKIGVDVLPAYARTQDEIGPAFLTMARERAEIVIVLPDGLLYGNRQHVAQLALKHRLPSITTAREFAEAGALISYGQDYAAYFRRSATYVDKIFKGAKPSELPVEQPTFVELAVNRKTAKTLGLTIPQDLLLRADKVID